MDFGTVILRWVALVGVLWLGAGCFGTSSGSRGVPLSAAMSASARGDRERVADRSRSSEYYEDDEPAAFMLLPPSRPHESSSLSEPFDDLDVLVISGGMERVFPMGGDIRAITRFELVPIAFQGEQAYGGVYCGWGEVRLDDGSLPDQALSGAWVLDAGLIGRIYLNAPKVFLSPYLTGGIFGQILYWDYRTPVKIGGETIDSDSVNGGGGFVGMGLAVARRHHLGVFAEARFGFALFNDSTSEGFANDVFEGYGFVSFRAGVSLGF
jgi:hypothetical protein